MAIQTVELKNIQSNSLDLFYSSTKQRDTTAQRSHEIQHAINAWLKEVEALHTTPSYSQLQIKRLN